MPTETAQYIYTSGTVTITIASTFNFNAALSSPIDNTTTGFLSLDVQMKIKTGPTVGTGGLYESAGVGLYLIRSVDAGNNYDQVIGFQQPATAVTNVDPPELLTVMLTPVAATTYVASFRLENVPQIFKFLLYNATGGFLDVTAANHYIKYSGKTLKLF